MMCPFLWLHQQLSDLLQVLQSLLLQGFGDGRHVLQGLEELEAGLSVLQQDHTLSVSLLLLYQHLRRMKRAEWRRRRKKKRRKNRMRRGREMCRQTQWIIKRRSLNKRGGKSRR